MNKYAFQQKLDDIDLLVSEGKYAEAVDEADLLNLDLVTQPRRLQTIAKAYEKCRRYTDAEDLLLQAKEYAPKSRGILFHLCNVATKNGDLNTAKSYYQEFQEIAPYDSERLILLYRIGKASNASDEDLIAILEEYKAEEPDDRWMYELAALYAKRGDMENAVSICDDILLWFYSGKYVQKAKMLKAQITGYADVEAEEPDESVVVPVNPRARDMEEPYPDETYADEFEKKSAAEEAKSAAVSLMSSYQVPTEKIPLYSEEFEKADVESSPYSMPAGNVDSERDTSFDAWEAAVPSEISMEEPLPYDMWNEEAPSGDTKIAPPIKTSKRKATAPKAPESTPSVKDTIAPVYPETVSVEPENSPVKPAAVLSEASVSDKVSTDDFLDDLFLEPEFKEESRPAEPVIQPETVFAASTDAYISSDDIIFEKPELLTDTFETVLADEPPVVTVMTEEAVPEMPALEEIFAEEPPLIEEPEDRPQIVHAETPDAIYEDTAIDATEILESFTETAEDLHLQAEPEESIKQPEPAKPQFTFDSVSGSNQDEMAAANELLKARENMSVSPDEWDYIVFDENNPGDVTDEVGQVIIEEIKTETLPDDDFGDIVIPDVPEDAVPVYTEADDTAKEEHVVISVTDEKSSISDLINAAEEQKKAKADEKEAEAKTEITKPDEPDAKTRKESVREEKVHEEKRAETLVKPAEDRTKAEERASGKGKTAGEKPAKKDDFEPDLSFTFDNDAMRLAQQIARRKAEEALFGGLPIEPDIVRKKVWHFFVYGETDALTLECAREKMKEIADENPSCPKRMLKISAKKIGDANIINSLDRFLGNMVIVQQASDLSDEQLRQFIRVLDKDDQSLLVAFTDTRRAVISMFERVPELCESFTGIYEGKKYTAKDLLEVAAEYLYTQDARLTEDGREAVLAEALRLLNERSGFYKNNIKLFAENGLEKADRGGFLGFGGGKTDKEGYLLVAGKHFR